MIEHTDQIPGVHALAQRSKAAQITHHHRDGFFDPAKRRPSGPAHQLLYDLIRQKLSEGFAQQRIPGVQLPVQFIDLFHGFQRILQLHKLTQIAEYHRNTTRLPFIIPEKGSHYMKLLHLPAGLVGNDSVDVVLSRINGIHHRLCKCIILRIIEKCCCKFTSGQCLLIHPEN